MEKDPVRLTLEDMAEKLNLSRRTISRVLRGDGFVASKTRDKILRHLKQEDYVPNVHASDLAAGRVRTMGLVLPKQMMMGTIDNYVGTIIQVLTETGHQRGHMLSLHPVDSLDVGEIQRQVRSRLLGGVILVAFGLQDHEAIRRLKAGGVPVALVNIRCPGVDSYDCDDETGGLLATRHLLDQGRRRIAFLHGDLNWSSSSHRFQGYEKALSAAGVPLDKELVGRGFFDTAAAESTVSIMLAKGPAFDALFAANDLMAIGAIKAIKKAGLRVPEDVAVVGFDDIPLCGLSLMEPTISSVRMPLEDIAGAACRRLMALMGGETPASQEILFPPKLVARGSSKT